MGKQDPLGNSEDNSILVKQTTGGGGGNDQKTIRYNKGER